jgi:hypothetical protein
MSATTDRDIAMRVAETDFKKALILARKVSEPWFRCQALAGTARYAPEEHVVQIAEEAIAASLTETEPYMKVAATAWPFRALIERNQVQKAMGAALLERRYQAGIRISGLRNLST